MELIMVLLMICLAGFVLSYCMVCIIDGFIVLLKEFWRLHYAEIKSKKEKKVHSTSKAERRTKL